MVSLIHHSYQPCIHIVLYKACALAFCVSVVSVDVAASIQHDGDLLKGGRIDERTFLLAGRS